MLASQESDERLLVSIDNESPPGAWAKELARAPWAYGQKQQHDRVAEALQQLRARGLTGIALTLEQEIMTLKATIRSLQEKP